MSVLDQLEELAVPQFIGKLDFEVSLQSFLTRFKTILTDSGIRFDVDELETDPAVVLLEVAAYADVNLRQRINEAFVAELLRYAVGTNLDHVAAFYQIYRLAGELDDAFRSRVVLGIQSKSGLETEWRYEFIARSADVRVRDVRAYVRGRSPTIYLAVLSTDNAGVADFALRNKITEAVNAPNRRAFNDTIVVEAAAQLITNIQAEFTLLPGADLDLINTIKDELQISWLQELTLGRDVTRSWLLSKLQVDGVHSVSLSGPALDVITPANRVAVMGEVSFEVAGRNY